MLAFVHPPHRYPRKHNHQKKKLPGNLDQIGRPYFGGNLGLGPGHLQPSTLPWRQIHVDVARCCEMLVCKLCKTLLKHKKMQFRCCKLKKSGQICMHLFLGFKGQGLSFLQKVSNNLEPNISLWQGWKSDNQSNQSSQSDERPGFHSLFLQVPHLLQWNCQAVPERALELGSFGMFASTRRPDR